MTAIQLLRDPNVRPDADTLAKALGERQRSYTELMAWIADRSIEVEWRYYNDGKAWLGKATRKSKTVFWLSVWEGYFQASFFFTERTLPEIATNVTEVGKLRAVVVKVISGSELSDLFELAQHKMNLKLSKAPR